MRYVTIAELSDLVRNNLHRIPHDIDLVVGIPRSGLLPANMISLYLNVQLTDIDSFVEGRIYGSGYRMRKGGPHAVKKVLVVDDSVQTGRAIEEAKEKLNPIGTEYDFVFLAPIVSSKGAASVDISFTVIDDFRIFEWNVFHHVVLSHACLDIDGVLCKDPETDDDGPVYQKFLQTATPLITPTVPVKTLVSCRLEKYRALTDSWLKDHGIEYEELIMLDFPDKEARVRWGRHGEFKASCYKDSPAWLFIESSAQQAEVIARLSHKPVLCIESNQLLFYESNSDRLKRKVSGWAPRMYQWLKRLVKG